MKRLISIFVIAIAVIIALILFKQSPTASNLIWSVSNKGTWLLPLVIFSALLDSIHPCSFSILLITIAFLFGMQMTRKRILQIGVTYVIGIFIAYLLIGLGLLKILHLFNTPHFMGKLGAGLLVAFGLINILNYLFPKFPIKLRLPSSAHSTMSRLIDKASIPAAFGLGLLVGICQFPCMGGPYLMVIGLLNDQVTYLKGVAYLFFYNALLITPLFIVLMIAADKVLVEKAQKWQQQEKSLIKIGGGIAMVVLGILIYFL
ncbi:MAG TPA: cytochrome c biogenesis protein CcdA [Candidatus Paceibacterota bacterium]